MCLGFDCGLTCGVVYLVLLCVLCVWIFLFDVVVCLVRDLLCDVVCLAFLRVCV